MSEIDDEHEDFFLNLLMFLKDSYFYTQVTLVSINFPGKGKSFQEKILTRALKRLFEVFFRSFKYTFQVEDCYYHLYQF